MHLKGLFLLSMTCGWLFSGPLDEWHSRTNFGASYLDDIAYGANVWVIVDGLPGQIITATNLAPAGTFSHRNVETGPYAVEYGAGRFVVTCRQGALMSSADGANWMTHAAAGGGYSSLLFANRRFVAVGNKISATSTNGTDWTTTPMSGFYSADIAFGNGIFVAGGGKTNAISTDGMTWEEVPSGIPTGFYTVGFGDGKFVGITTQNEIMTSTDARAWTAHGKLDLLRPGRIAWGNGYFVTAGGSARAYSRDGISWTVMASGTTEYNVEFINGSFIATGYKTIYQSSSVIGLSLQNAGELRLFGEPGQSYRIEGSGDLAAWEAQGTAKVSDGESSCIFRPVPGTAVPHRFFRAVVTE